jgi:hypothetical protein
MPDTRPKISDADLENWFTYHPPPNAETTFSYERIRRTAKRLATEIRDTCPASADTTAAIRKIREACFTANASIACDTSKAQLSTPDPTPEDEAYVESLRCRADDMGLPEDPLEDAPPVDDLDDPNIVPASVDPGPRPPPLTDPPE